jgi:hypothetical protein
VSEEAVARLLEPSGAFYSLLEQRKGMPSLGQLGSKAGAQASGEWFLVSLSKDPGLDL